MELREFLKKFLPDYEVKKIECGKCFIPPLIDDEEDLLVYGISDRYFPEALQNFALKIYEAQITLVKNEVMMFANKKSPSDVISTINNCGHPKINELWQH